MKFQGPNRNRALEEFACLSPSLHSLWPEDSNKMNVISVAQCSMMLSCAAPRVGGLRSSRVISDIGSLGSQMSGMKISPIQLQKVPHLNDSVPLRPSLQPVARRVCPFTGKKPNKANHVSHSNHKTIRRQFVNLQYKRIWWEEGKRYVKLRLSTKAIKTIEKNGLSAVAKKAGIDLSKK